MKSTLKKVAIVLAALIAAVLLYAAVKNPHYEVARGVTIHAPAAKVFPYLNNMVLANSWNPWIKRDPDAKLVLSGPPEGPGAKTSWVSGAELGTGSATIIETVPNERVVIKLEYQKPFAMTQEAAYILTTAGDQTAIIWKVYGNQTFLCRLFSIFMNMDKMIGDIFAQGLQDLKTIVEKGA